LAVLLQNSGPQNLFCRHAFGASINATTLDQIEIYVLQNRRVGIK